MRKLTRYGEMVFNPRDRYVGRSLELYGEYSPEEAALFQGLVPKGAVALDVGAHVGPHTLALARAVGPRGGVFAFEPQRVLFQMLCANMALNDVTWAFCYHAAVGCEEGTVTVPSLDYEKENNFAGLALGGWEEGEAVQRLTIDSLGLGRCDFMKVDVEGMELDVLQGAAETIGRFRTVLYVENDREAKCGDLVAFLEGLGYELYWHKPPYFSPDNFEGHSDDVFGNVVSFNMLCFHCSLQTNVQGLVPVG